MNVEEKERARRLWRQGKTCPEIAREIGMHSHNIWRFLKKEGLTGGKGFDAPRRRWDVDKAITMRLEGKKIKEIAQELGVHWKTVATMLRECGIQKWSLKPKKIIKPKSD